MAGWVKDTISGKADNYNYLDDSGNKATNTWKQDSTGKWAYLNDTGDWAKSTTAKDSNGFAQIGADGYFTGGYGAPTTPGYKAFKPTVTMDDSIKQANTLLLPSLQSNINDINDSYNTGVISTNNDTLSRGLARSSYGGNRIDNLGKTRDTMVSKANLNNQIAANSMASTLYNNAYNQGYQQNSDLNNWNMNTYNADNSNYQFGVNRNDNLAQNAQSQSNWQKTFDYNAAQDAQNHALTLKKSNNSGGSGGSGSGSSSGSSSSTKVDAKYTNIASSAMNAFTNNNGDARAAIADLTVLRQKLLNDNSQNANDTRDIIDGEILNLSDKIKR